MHSELLCVPLFEGWGRNSFCMHHVPFFQSTIRTTADPFTEWQSYFGLWILFPINPVFPYWYSRWDGLMVNCCQGKCLTVFFRLISRRVRNKLVCTNTTHSFGWVFNSYRWPGSIQQLGSHGWCWWNCIWVWATWELFGLCLILPLGNQTQKCSFAQLQHFCSHRVSDAETQRAVVLTIAYTYVQ